MKHKPWESAILNNATFDYYFNFLKLITINRLKFTGLPETVDERFLKRGLFDKGQMLWFQDEEIGDLCLYFTTGGQKSVYDVPLLRQVYTSNGIYHTQRTYKNSVIIYNNYNRLPDYHDVEMFALRLADLQRTIDVNVKGQKTPKIITSNESQRLVMKNLFMQWDGNEPFIFGDKKLRDEIKLDVLDTTAPYVVDKLEIQKHMLINEFLTSKGITNANNDKKERLVQSEVSSNYGLVEMARNAATSAIQEGLDEVNKMFGHNVQVEFQTDIYYDIPINGEEGEENG